MKVQERPNVFHISPGYWVVFVAYCEYGSLIWRFVAEKKWSNIRGSNRWGAKGYEREYDIFVFPVGDVEEVGEQEGGNCSTGTVASEEDMMDVIVFDKLMKSPCDLGKDSGGAIEET